MRGRLKNYMHRLRQTHRQVDGLKVKAGCATVELLYGSLGVAHGQQHLVADERGGDASWLALLAYVSVVQGSACMEGYECQAMTQCILNGAWSCSTAQAPRMLAQTQVAERQLPRRLRLDILAC